MLKNYLKQLATVVAGALLVLGFGAGGALAKVDLLVYTAIEADELAMFKREFEKDYPDINVKWVRDSTGIVTSKLLAEISSGALPPPAWCCLATRATSRATRRKA